MDEEAPPVTRNDSEVAKAIDTFKEELAELKKIYGEKEEEEDKDDSSIIIKESGYID